MLSAILVVLASPQMIGQAVPSEIFPVRLWLVAGAEKAIVQLSQEEEEEEEEEEEALTAPMAVTMTGALVSVAVGTFVTVTMAVGRGVAVTMAFKRQFSCRGKACMMIMMMMMNEEEEEEEEEDMVTVTTLVMLQQLR
ncbi:hypothetical protein AK812_SmicGene22801 [Symbiodinium microadriaticum]|uniref:Uncharacterized protein n=1 Tax=Symbiodinium microadriaticum TaxID=2951 RepID=A0A1Q9DIY7_SYMMI|nr:hypothetical protein AK812_SmicGene22801 [Symbiodinium microadriaticum]